MDRPAVRLSNVCFSYPGTPSQKVFENFSLDIEQGSFVCIMGPNGSGKSTLAKLLNGILSPTSGTIEKSGKNISLVFQNPDSQIVASVVEDDTAFGPENLGIESSKIRKIVNSALEDVSMQNWSTANISTLSGGQKQRVCIAGALAMKGQCLVLDEPCSMLDPTGKEEVMSVLEKLNKTGCTIILITHDIDLASFSERLILLSDGKIVADAKPETVFENTALLSQCSLTLSPALELKKFIRNRQK